MKKSGLRFESKKDWLVAIVYLVLGTGIGLIWSLPYYGDLIFRVIITVFLGIILGLFTWAVFSTYYLFTDDFLICISGPLKLKIPYKSITEIRESHCGWSSLALSFDRVLIKRGRNFLLNDYVSPKNKQIFMEELKNRVEKVKGQ